MIKTKITKEFIEAVTEAAVFAPHDKNAGSADGCCVLEINGDKLYVKATGSLEQSYLRTTVCEPVEGQFKIAVKSSLLKALLVGAEGKDITFDGDKYRLYIGEEKKKAAINGVGENAIYKIEVPISSCFNDGEYGDMVAELPLNALIGCIKEVNYARLSCDTGAYQVLTTSFTITTSDKGLTVFAIDGTRAGRCTIKCDVASGLSVVIPSALSMFVAANKWKGDDDVTVKIYNTNSRLSMVVKDTIVASSKYAVTPFDFDKIVTWCDNPTSVVFDVKDIMPTVNRIIAINSSLGASDSRQKPTTMQLADGGVILRFANLAGAIEEFVPAQNMNISDKDSENLDVDVIGLDAKRLKDAFAPFKKTVKLSACFSSGDKPIIVTDEKPSEEIDRLHLLMPIRNIGF